MTRDQFLNLQIGDLICHTALPETVLVIIEFSREGGYKLMIVWDERPEYIGKIFFALYWDNWEYFT